MWTKCPVTRIKKINDGSYTTLKSIINCKVKQGVDVKK